ncbi:MAG TPA: hypothetical protein VNI61_11890 [Gemmatimonadales bacterium]|nr:hypothetical protein [Gemmatimonadales bacterium]
MLRRLVLLAVLAAVPACARASEGDEGPVPRTETMLRVENQDFFDMTIYVIRSGQRIRLGTVPGLSSRVLAIPPSLVGGGVELRFLADPVGSNRTPVSHEIFVQPGDVVELIIPAQPR